MSKFLACAALALVACQPGASAQEKPAEQQIGEAILALPESFRADAAVLGFSRGKLAVIREGANEMICLADTPGDERWQVACYHKDLDPFMARGRELRAEGKSADDRRTIRFAEIEAGDLEMPRYPTTLYVLSGPVGAYDAATGEVNGASPRYVLYIPFATQEQTGISTEPSRERIWLMLPGTPGAHIMIPGS